MNSFDFEKVLTIGAGGMIGSYVDFGYRPSHQELDILDEEAVMQYVEKRVPQAILYLAGATDTERCEREPLYAYELNVRGTQNVARVARTVGATLVYASTSRVFRGDKKEPYTEADIPDPQTYYGLTKYLGELVSASLPHHIIARTAWVFGGGVDRDDKFYGKILQKLKTNEPEIVALNDVYGSPTYAKDYIDAIKDLLAKGAYGTFHIANAGVATRYDLACAMALQVNSDAKIDAVDRTYFPHGRVLPSNEAIIGAHSTLRPWQDALAEYVSEEWKG